MHDPCRAADTEQSHQQTIGYNHVHRFGTVKHALMTCRHNFDVIALTETTRTNDHPITKLFENNNWIRKNRIIPFSAKYLNVYVVPSTEYMNK